MTRDPRDIIVRPVVSEKSYASFDANVRLACAHVSAAPRVITELIPPSARI